MTAKKKKLDELETASGKTPKKRGRPKKTKLDEISYADGRKEDKIKKAKAA